MKHISAALLLILSLVGSANAQIKSGPPTDTTGLAKLARPIVLVAPANLPDVPECRGILSQDIIDTVNTADEDPAVGFERNRRAHPHMIMMPPPLECASELWRSVRNDAHLSSGPSVPKGTEAFSLRQYPVESLFNVHALSASVGGNVELNSGLENYQGETNIAVDPNNPQHLVAQSNTFFKDTTPACQSPTGGLANTYGTMALFGSTDGGATWTYNCAPWPATVTGGVASATFWFGSDPALAWDNQGRAYATYMLISQSNAGASGASIVTARSSDNGATWQSLGTVVSGIASTTQGNDKEMMAIDNTTGQPFSHPGRIFVIWDAANAEKIAYSDDGAAWTTVNFASNTGAIGGNVVVGSDGTVYAIWNRYNVETIVFTKSIDGGATWTAPAVISTMALQSFGSNNTPPAQDQRSVNAFASIDIDRNPASAYFGNIYIAFPDFPAGTTSGADINTYMITSSNGGATWSARVKVNDDSFGATQIFPWLAVDQSDGTVNVSWYDTRLDPLNRKTQMVYARSSNGGVSFEPNILITDNGGAVWRNAVNYSDENSVDNSTFNSNQYGDYTGIAAANRQVHPLWTDSRAFFPTADSISPTRREDNATSTIVNCSTPTTVAAPAVNPTTTPSVVVSWAAPTSWGTNGTAGTYSVYRATSNVFPGGSPLVSGLTSTNYVDTTGVTGTTYFYFVRAKNNCPGTALTPMSTDSVASIGVIFGNAGTAVGTLQGTVTAAGNPVSGATVSAGTFSATTNASGFYQISAMDVGTYNVSASAAGYSTASVNGVVVTAGATTIQNLSLTPATSSACFTDTSFGDFSTGTGTNVSLTSSAGDVKLATTGSEAVDKNSAPAALSTTNNLSATTWTGQTFQAGATGTLTKLSVALGLASGTSGTITAEIRNINGTTPGTTVLATTTFGPVTNVGSAALYTSTFATPASLVSGTSYSIVLRTSVGSTVFGVRGSTAGGSTLPNGSVFTTTNSGTTWTAVGADLWFTTYVTPPFAYQTSGNIVSSTKDSTAVTGSATTWSTLSWTGTTPANTTLRFQAAASNSASGPFTFVGPDGTAGTFFTTSGASLAQFNGKRYLQYKAFLDTTDTLATPTLSDVTVCEQVVDCSSSVPTITPTPASVCPSSTGNTASSSSASTYAWSITNGTITSGTSAQSVTYTAGASGSVILGLTITTASGCTASNTSTITINSTAAPTISTGGPTTFCAGGSVTLTSSSATGNQWSLNGTPIGGATSSTYAATLAGDYTVVATNGGCTTAASAPTTVTVTPAPATPTITPGGPTTFCTGGSVTLTSSSATGNQWSLNGNPIGGATNQTYNAIASGDYTVVVTSGGCSSTASAATTVTVNPLPATPTITPGGPTTFCTGGSVTLTSSSVTGNQWNLNGNPIGGATSSTYAATASGDYTVVVTTSGCSSAASAATTVTVNPIPATPVIGTGGPTTFCAGGSVTLTSSSATGNQWSLNGSPIGGATSQTYNAIASGNYTVVVTTGGCSSAASAATTVTVNPIPATPTITPGGPTTFCAGGSVTLTSSSATGNQWSLNGSPIGGATNQTYSATASGNYTVVVTTSGCSSAASASTAVTVNPIPSTPVIGTGGPTTFCAGGSVDLVSGTANGNQWYLNGNPIGGATSQTYNATASGNYTVVVTTSGCSSAASAATTVTVNPIPATPTINAGGATTFCAGGSVTLTSSSATGNQWSLNGSPIGGATSSTYAATASGNYTVVVTGNGCSSSASAATSVTVNPIPSTPVIGTGGPTTFCAGGSVDLVSGTANGNQWYLNGNPIGGATSQTYNATASGNYTVVVTTSGCSSAASAATTVTVNPIPSTPTINAGGATTFCVGGSVTLTSSSASGNQWFLNGNPIGGATSSTYAATASGNYTVVVTGSGCSSTASAATTVTVNPIPATPTINAGGSTTFCVGGSVTLTSSSASGNQWFLNGNPIGGATSSTYAATASGDYTVVVTGSGCSSSASAATTVTVNQMPATPTINAGGPTTFCTGGSVTLTSSSASGNQWFLNGNPIGGATSSTYVAAVAGDYSVTVTTSGCSSAASGTTTVTINSNPNATITAPASVVTASTGNVASVADAGVGAAYTWSITGGTITAGSGTRSITFTAGASGTLTLNVTVVTAGSCSDSQSAGVTVTTAAPTVTVTSIAPSTGSFHGGTSITITGSGFAAGATVTLGGTAATNVVIVNSTTITAKTAAHAAGAVNVQVTNADTSNATLTNGFTYTPQQFDPNGDLTVDPADIFYLVNYLFTGGPAPAGAAGMPSGDANGDGVVDPADIFYAVNYLFSGGPQPMVVPPGTRVATSSVSSQLSGSVTLGTPFLRGDHYVVPVIVAGREGAAAQALSLKVQFDGAGTANIHRAGVMANEQPTFEISRHTGNTLSYMVVYSNSLAGTAPGVVAEIEVASASRGLRIEVDPSGTLLSDQSGTRKATVANGTLRISGVAIDAPVRENSPKVQ